MSHLVRIDWRLRRVWVRDQRIHHGPWALAVGPTLLVAGLWARQGPAAALGAALTTWGLSDLHDRSVWFARGPQI